MSKREHGNGAASTAPEHINGTKVDTTTAARQRFTWYDQLIAAGDHDLVGAAHVIAREKFHVGIERLAEMLKVSEPTARRLRDLLLGKRIGKRQGNQHLSSSRGRLGRGKVAVNQYQMVLDLGDQTGVNIDPSEDVRGIKIDTPNESVGVSELTPQNVARGIKIDTRHRVSKLIPDSRQHRRSDDDSYQQERSLGGTYGEDPQPEITNGSKPSNYGLSDDDDDEGTLRDKARRLLKEATNPDAIIKDLFDRDLEWVAKVLREASKPEIHTKPGFIRSEIKKRPKKAQGISDLYGTYEPHVKVQWVDDDGEVREFTTGADGRIPRDITSEIMYERQCKRDEQSQRRAKKIRDRDAPPF
jgi:hypothetical protein